MKDTMTTQIAYELLSYIAKNMETESIFLTPVPSTTVEVKGLIDKIAELRNVDELANGIFFNEILDKL